MGGRNRESRCKRSLRQWNVEAPAGDLADLAGRARDQPVFLVATANCIDHLPPELIRKGRLDEIFFVDLPDSAARIKIFDIRLSNHGQRAQALDLEELARHSEGFSGAEIEQAIVAALYLAREHEGPLDTGHLLTASRQTRPLSVVMTERLSALRSWAKNRRGSAN